MSLHQELIDEILSEFPEARAFGFPKLIRKITDGHLRRPGVLPDAFIYEAEEQRVVAFEVEVYRNLTPEKLCLYGHLAWDLDFYDQDFLLVRCDPYGRRDCFTMDFPTEPPESRISLQQILSGADV